MIIRYAEAKTDNTRYTGDTKEWPDGLYNCELYYILKYKDTCLYFGAPLKNVVNPFAEDTVWFDTIETTDCYFTKIPGYTGGLAAITPEFSEGE